MIVRPLAQQLLFGRFLIERDALSACFTRLGSGFTPLSEIRSAQLHLDNIKGLLDKMDIIKEYPKTTPIAKDYHQLMEGCCPKK
jgi:hypothetical protein